MHTRHGILLLNTPAEPSDAVGRRPWVHWSNHQPRARQAGPTGRPQRLGSPATSVPPLPPQHYPASGPRRLPQHPRFSKPQRAMPNKRTTGLPSSASLRLVTVPRCHGNQHFGVRMLAGAWHTMRTLPGFAKSVGPVGGVRRPLRLTGRKRFDASALASRTRPHVVSESPGTSREARAVTPTLPRLSGVCLASFPPGVPQSDCAVRPESAGTRVAFRSGFVVAPCVGRFVGRPSTASHAPGVSARPSSACPSHDGCIVQPWLPVTDLTIPACCVLPGPFHVRPLF